MSRIVQKFGGTSVATLDRIQNVAKIVADSRRSSNNDIVVVVSAMAGVTNKFADYVNALGANEGHPEYDTVLSSGELVTAGLTAIALQNAGIKSRSYASWQVPIITNCNHGRAVIQDVDPSNMVRDLSEGIVPVVCGFQGVSKDAARTTTLGRGGSDLTAVAVASAVGADVCEIYSDVDGVYTADPNLYASAQKIEQIGYAEMLEMAAQGAKVLQEQSVRYAMEKNVVIRVASSFIEAPGTLISPSAPAKTFCGMAITPMLSQLLLTPKNSEQSVVPSEPKESFGNECFSDDFRNAVRDILANNFIQTDFLHRKNRSTLLLNKHQAHLAVKLLRDTDFIAEVRYKFSRKPLSKLSIVGNGLSIEKAQDLVIELKQNHIDSFVGTISEHKINLLIAFEHLLDGISVLHKHCGLNNFGSNK